MILILKTYSNAFIVIMSNLQLLFILDLCFIHVSLILYYVSVAILRVCKDIYEHSSLLHRERKMHNSLITSAPILLSHIRIIIIYIGTLEHELVTMKHNRFALAVCHTLLSVYNKKHRNIKRMVSNSTYIIYHTYYILLNYALIYQNIYYVGHFTFEKQFFKTKNG